MSNFLGVSADGYGYHPTQQDSRKNVSLRCYDCNSEFDPRCGDPFDPYTIGIVNCTDRRPPEQLLELAPDIQPKVCRKLVQKGKILNEKTFDKLNGWLNNNLRGLIKAQVVEISRFRFVIRNRNGLAL